MKAKVCQTCGGKMKKNGTTKAGTQRWRCVVCNASATHKIDTEQRSLALFVRWLLSKDSQKDMPGEGRTFRRHTAQFWKLWPLPEIVDEIHSVIFVDGIYLARNVVILIACSERHVLSWYLARAETSRSWEALLSRIAPPLMVVTDGGSGFAKAAANKWPNTRVQRCTFHAFCQVKRCTTSRPKLQAGIELYAIAKELMHIKTLKHAQNWVERFFEWCDCWNEFLNEKSRVDGKWVYTHERLRKARRGLVTLINKNTLFTYLDPALCAEGPMPSMNNTIEGGVNRYLREVLRNHRGLPLIRRIKAVYWWCYMHTECPKSYSEILRSMPTDDDIDLLYKLYAINPKDQNGPVEWGEGLVWNELHHSTPYPYSLD